MGTKKKPFAWNPTNERTREEPSHVIRVYDVQRIAETLASLATDPHRADRAMFAGLVAVVYVRYPRDGAGRLRLLVADYLADPEGHLVWQESSAGGGGYDKLTAALSGLTVGGVTLGDHCNRSGAPRLETLCDVRPNWAVVKS